MHTNAPTLVVLALVAGGVACASSGAPVAAAPPQPDAAPAPAASAQTSWRPMSTADPARPSKGWRARSAGCSASADGRDAARQTFQQGVSAYAEGNFTKALDFFTQAYDQTCSPRVLYNVAVTLEKMGLRDDAIDVLELFLEKEPDASQAQEARRTIDRLRSGP